MKKKEPSLYDNIAKSYYGNKPTTHSFFYHLYKTPKPTGKKTTDNELIWWFIKIKIGQIYLELNQKKLNFYTQLTRYYPFSLLFRDRIFHDEMKDLRRFVEKLENQIKSYGLKMIVTGNRIENDMTIFSTVFEKEPGRSKLNFVEKHLQKEYESVFIRKNNEEINLVFPSEVLKKYY